MAATRRPDGSWMPPGGPVATQAAGSGLGFRADVRLTRGLHELPLSGDLLTKICWLSREKSRWIAFVVRSAIGAGLPMVWPGSASTWTMSDHVAPSSAEERLTIRTSP
eukprot:1735964-Prymnesium_polylepis.1